MQLHVLLRASLSEDAGESEQRESAESSSAEDRLSDWRYKNLDGITALQITHTVTEGFADLFKHTPCRNSQYHKLLPISLCSPSLKTFQINESEAKVTQSVLGCLPSKQGCQE